MCKFSNTAKRGTFDSCMIEVLYVLKAHGISTVASCCGHGRYPMTILYRDQGRISELFTGAVIDRKCRFYRKDSEGMYFIPETIPTESE